MMDRRCFLLHNNALAAAALTDGGGWVGLPANLGAGDLYEHVARHVGGGVASITLDWGRRRSVGGLALVGYTGPKTGKIRLTWRRGGDVVGPPAWERISQRAVRSQDLLWEDPNWWRGDGDGDTYLFIPPARLRVTSLTIDIDAGGAAEFDLSYLYVASLWRPDWPMGWGRALDLTSRTRASKTRAGGLIAGPRLRPQRTMQVTFEELTDREREAWQRIAAAHDAVDPLLFIPDPGDRIAWGSEVFLARLTKLAGWKQVGFDRNQVTLEIEEMVA
jgi:hypothetical protein